MRDVHGVSLLTCLQHCVFYSAVNHILCHITRSLHLTKDQSLKKIPKITSVLGSALHLVHVWLHG